MEKFKNREHAGQELVTQLAKYQSQNSLVMAIPNGGIPVALPIARSFKTTLSLIPIRSLRIPWAEQTIFGYVTATGDLHVNQPLVGQTRLSPVELHQIAKRERRALQADLIAWGVDVPANLNGNTVLIVDDGMHSGWTMFSAIETVKLLGAESIVAAVPVTHFRARRFVTRHCDEVVALFTDDIALYEIRNYYLDFPEIQNNQVKPLLETLPAKHESAA